MDLSTEYLGFKLRTPLIASASPLSYELDDVKRLEDSGISAIVLHSLFEEQLVRERFELHHHLTYGVDSFAESLSFFPETDDYELGAESYLEHIRQAKAAVKIPIIASLNGDTPGGWLEFSRLMEEAGADAIELNIYNIPTDPNISPRDIENSDVEIIKDVRREVKIPIALKISPFFTNLSYSAKMFTEAGADALVLFNRFFQPDFDLENLDVKPHILLSTNHDLRLPLRWVALLYGKIKADLAGTGGVHTPQDAIKLMMAGAKVSMLFSALLKNGIEYVKVLEDGIVRWMEENEYESIRQMQGSMSHLKSQDPNEFERAMYMKALHSVQIHHS